MLEDSSTIQLRRDTFRQRLAVTLTDRFDKTSKVSWATENRARGAANATLCNKHSQDFAAGRPK